MKTKRWLLYLTSFFAGCSIMGIELGASRLLTPYFSSSQIVWTIVIGTIMVAMALGNVLGGALADRSKSAGKLFLWLFAAAVWCALIPLVGKFVIMGVAVGLALFVTKNYLIWAALASCILVFVFPLLVLGMVTPNLVKFALKDSGNSGKTVGIFEALNTIGSIIGTVLPTFVTIPNIGTALTFVLFSAFLMLPCIIYGIFLFCQRVTPKNVKIKIILLGIIAVISIFGGVYSRKLSAAFWETENVLYEGESVYNYLRVEDTPNSVYLSTNVLFGVQSVKPKTSSLTGMYYDYALCAMPMANAVTGHSEVLILGLCSGTFASQCRTFFPDSHITGVEIDDKIVDLAYEYFDLSPDVDVIIGDGRTYIDRCDERFNVIMVDAYQDITIPPSMSTVEFFTSVKKRLTAGGVMVVNMNLGAEGEGGINEYILGTIAQVFPNVYCAPAGSSNLVVFASADVDPKEKLYSYVSESPVTTLTGIYERTETRMDKVEKRAEVLTDDCAPVELLGMRVLDKMISEELSYYKGLFEGKSIKEILDLILNGDLF